VSTAPCSLWLLSPQASLLTMWTFMSVCVCVLCKALNCISLIAACVLGQLGLGRLENKPQVSINNSFPSVLQVSAGANHTAVLTKSGQVRSILIGYC
jgi:hypothetical protein